MPRSRRAPVTRPCSTMRSTSIVPSSMRTARRRTVATRAAWMAAPVASPPAWRIRARVCAASRPRSSPDSSRSKPTPNRMRSRTRAGPWSQSTRTASWSARPGARLDGVGEVSRGGVVGEERRRDAALRVARAALVECRLGDELDRVARVGRLHGRPEPGDAAADDEHVHHVRLRRPGSAQRRAASPRASARGRPARGRRPRRRP